MLGAERVDRDRGNERRVDAARQADEYVGEAVFRHVVARAEHEGFVDLLDGRKHGLDACCHAVVADPGVRDGDLGELLGTRTATRIELPFAERRAHVEVHHEQILDELLGAGHEVTLLVEDDGRPVEHELVLPADEVRVDDRHGRVGGAGRQHRLALSPSLRVVGGRVQVDDELGAARRLFEDRTARAPRVLADRDADLDARDQEQIRCIAARYEVALFVEHGVVRKQLFAVRAVDAPVRAHGGRVVQVASGSGKPMTAAQRPVRAAILSSVSTACATNAGRRRRSSGG